MRADSRDTCRVSGAVRRTKVSEARTRGPHFLVYGFFGFGAVLVAEYCADIGTEEVTVGLPWLSFGRFDGLGRSRDADVPVLPGHDGANRHAGRSAGAAAIDSAKPCRVIAQSPGLAWWWSAAHEAAAIG